MVTNRTRSITDGLTAVVLDHGPYTTHNISLVNENDSVLSLVTRGAYRLPPDIACDLRIFRGDSKS